MSSNFNVHQFLRSIQDISNTNQIKIYLSGNPPPAPDALLFPIFPTPVILCESLKKIAPTYHFSFDQHGVFVSPASFPVSLTPSGPLQ